jgi:PAS domain S-box-containing protein
MDVEGIKPTPDRRGRRLELVTPDSAPDDGKRTRREDSAHALSPSLQIGAGVLGAGLACAALVAGLSVSPLDDAADVGRAIAQALAIAIPVAVGLYALRRAQTSRFAILLIITGLAWAPTVLAMSDHSVPYSVGRVWAWGVLAWVVYLLLAFPDGRLTGRAERWTVWSAVALVAIFYLPAAAFDEFQTPSPWADCGSACPPNAFIVSDSAPGLIATLTGMRDVVGVLVYAAAAAVLGLKWMRGSHTARRVHGPVVWLAIAEFATTGGFIAMRRLAPHTDLTEVAGVFALLATPALVLAFLAGLVRWRIAAFSTWRRLNSDGEATRIRDVLADAIGDATLEIGYWGGHERGWIDHDGRPFALPAKGSVRAVTEVSSGGGRQIAILVHEDSYAIESGLREVVQGVTLMALANQQLEADARASLRELSESRARILSTIDRDRLRIERDLHDGAQQRLIALKIAAERGAQNVSTDADEAAALLRRIGSDAGAALDEVRALARGVYPALLVDHGIVEALRDAASRSAINAEVRARGVRRYPQEVEAAVYFCCLEALQNAEKHSGASAVRIDLIGNGELRFEVRDDGCGFDPALEEHGSGLGNMSDRVAVVGGKLRIDSVPGGGTRVAGHVPMLPDHVPAEIERLVLRAADALEDAMGIYRAVRTSSGTVVDFAVEHVNDAACKMTGLSRESQVGKTLGQLRPGYVRSPAFDFHRQALESDVALLHEDCEYVGTEGSRRLQSAHEVRAAALGADRLALVWRDITARKRADHALSLRAEALSRERDGVCIVSASNATIVYANARLEEMFGYAHGELEGRQASELDWRDETGAAAVGGMRALWRAADRFELACSRKDGSVIWCEVTIDGFEDDDLGWCWVAVHHDITDRRAAGRALEEQRDQLDLALRSLPALAYATDRDLQTTLLFDSLVDPDRTDTPCTGSDAELLGPLARRVTKLNARALVTGVRVEGEFEVDIRGPVTVLIRAEPMYAPDGAFAGVVGSVVQRSPEQVGADVVSASPRAERSRLRLRR